MQKMVSWAHVILIIVSSVLPPSTQEVSQHLPNFFCDLADHFEAQQVIVAIGTDAMTAGLFHGCASDRRFTCVEHVTHNDRRNVAELIKTNKRSGKAFMLAMTGGMDGQGDLLKLLASCEDILSPDFPVVADQRAETYITPRLNWNVLFYDTNNRD